MKVMLDIRDGRGSLFRGCVEATSTSVALCEKMAELKELHARPFASLCAQASPFEVMKQATALRPQAPWKKKEEAA